MSLSPSPEERQPLVPSNSQRSNHEEASRTSKAWEWLTAINPFSLDNPIIICTFCLQFLTYFSKHMVEVPMIKLFEQAICNRYYHSRGHRLFLLGGNIDEASCKIPPVQNELAALTGLKFTFDALPGLLTALYYGSMADRFGRRLVLALCCAGTMCSLLWILLVCYADTNLPIRLVWASSIFLCLGGSQRVAKGMNFTVVADATEVSHR